MAFKLIMKDTPRNRERVSKRINHEYITIKLTGNPDQRVTPRQALLMGSKALQSRQAIQAYEIATQLCVNYADIVDTQILKANALLMLQELVEAKSLIELLFSKAPNNSAIRTLAIRLKILLGQIDGACELLKPAVAKRDINALFLLADCYRFTGKQDKSSTALHKCLQVLQKKKQGSGQASEEYQNALTQLAGNELLTEAQLTEMQTILENEQANTQKRATMAFALAKQAEMNKAVNEEIALLDLANHLKCQSLPNHPDQEAFKRQLDANLETQKRLFSSAKPDWLKDFTPDTQDTPVFILGMPRSGTTLMEQMLGNHSLVGQTGESRALPIGISEAYRKHHPACSLELFPEQLETLPHQALSDIASYYQKHQALLTNKKIYLDKELSCYKYVGLTAPLFPKARFVHMNRPPMDIFLSCYKNSISGIPSTYDVRQMAYQYIYMKQLIGHWQTIFPERVFVMDYAKLVEEPEAEIKRLIEWLGLEFEPEVLEFHKRKNAVRTISLYQVRQGIYKTAVKKWLPYAEMLEPARRVLEEHGIGEEGIQVL